MMRFVRFGTTFIFILALCAAQSTPVSAALAHSLLISELQTSGCVAGSNPCVEDAKAEFIELYNPNSVSLQMANWKVQYLSASGATTTVLSTFSGSVAPHGYALVAGNGYY